jgi:hypothetical protein
MQGTSYQEGNWPLALLFTKDPNEANRQTSGADRCRRTDPRAPYRCRLHVHHKTAPGVAIIPARIDCGAIAGRRSDGNTPFGLSAGSAGRLRGQRRVRRLSCERMGQP